MFILALHPQRLAIFSAFISVIAASFNGPTTLSNASRQGVSGCIGGVKPRLNVFDLQQNEDQWNIFLLAMQSFQQQDYTDPMSYYQIAGIHGAPYIPYAGVQRCQQCAMTGYCCHLSTLFPTWHRVYVALFEQALQGTALAIAQMFQGDDYDRFISAATDLRMPYWDWAAPMVDGEDPLPTIFTDDTVNVNTPTGPETISNPLQKFTFPPGADNSFTVDPSSGTTVRRSTLTAASRKQLRADTWNLLTSQSDYEAFSTEALVSGQASNPNSLEAVHDQIHILVGGDMGYVPSAGFDPIFFFHHCNIDRLLAIWQTVYSTSWLEPWKEVGQTYTYTSGSVQNSSSPLTPFLLSGNSTDRFWDTDYCRATDSLNYEYPEIASGNRADAINLINSLYRDDSMSTDTKRDTLGIIGAYDSPGEVQEYIANVKADSMGTCGSFTVFIFDGDFDDSNPDGWHSEANLTGCHGFFAGPDVRGDGTSLVNAGISLTRRLLQDVMWGRLGDMSTATVTRYLRDSISWRVQLVNGTTVEAESIPGLEIAVMASEVQLPVLGIELPGWGEWQYLTEVTQDKTNGYSGGGLLGSFTRSLEDAVGNPLGLLG